MRITCPECRTVYEVEDKLIPSAGVGVKCVNCGNTFSVKKEGPGDEKISLEDISAKPAEPAIEEAAARPVASGTGSLAEELGISSQGEPATAATRESESAGGLESTETERAEPGEDASIAVEELDTDMAEDFGDLSFDTGEPLDDFSFDDTEFYDMSDDLMELQLGADMVDYSIMDEDIDALLEEPIEIGEGLTAGLADETVPVFSGGVAQEDDKKTALTDLESLMSEAAKEAGEEPDLYENLSGGQFDISGLLDEKAEAVDLDEFSDIEPVIEKSVEDSAREEAPGEEPAGGQLEINDITFEETPDVESINIEPEEINLDEADAATLEIGEELPGVEETAQEAEKAPEEAVDEAVPEAAEELSLDEISLETEEIVDAAASEPAVEGESGLAEEPAEIGLDMSEEGGIGLEQTEEAPEEEIGIEAVEESEPGEPATDLAEPEPAGFEADQPVETEENLLEETAEPAEAFADEEGLDELIHKETGTQVDYSSSVPARPAHLARFTIVDILVAVAAVTVAVAVVAFVLEKIGLLRAVQ